MKLLELAERKVLMSELLTFDIDGKVGILTINSPPVNALGFDVRNAILTGLKKAWEAPEVEIVVIMCAGRTFFAGADIREFGKPPQPPLLPDVLSSIEDGPKPTVAAIHGTALGGGLELALHCNFRVAIESAKVGLPEVALGILPGAGGTQRLPRVVGVPAALDLITSGRAIGAVEALDYGIIDALIDNDDMRAGAISFARGCIDDGKQITRIRDRDDKIAPYRGKPEIYDEFRQKNRARFRGFKAPENIIKAIEAAVELPFDEGMKRERELFLELRSTVEADAQRYVFFAERQTTKIPDVPKDTATRPVQKIGVIGAGTMGGGIAMNFLNVGLPVVLVERAQDALDRGISVIQKNYDRSAKRGRLSRQDVEGCMNLITPTTDMNALSDVDLVIEAVFETMPIKKDVFEQLDKIAKPGAILASNTSYLDIDEIALATNRPEDVIGLHFFSPANVMALLEIVRGEKTSKDIVNTSMKLAKKIGKTPVLSRVCYGFIANRIMSVRRTQSQNLAFQGVSPELIDSVIYDYGFAMGPFQVLDLVGLDVLGRGDNTKTIASELVRLGRLGQKQNGGIYDYDENRKRTLSPIALNVIREIAEENGIAKVDADRQEILERLTYPIINEGAKVLAEGVALRGSDIDIACIKGYNWPIYRGGPMFWADTVGLPEIVSKLKEFEDRFSAEFTPSPFLEDLAKSGKRLSDVTT